MGMADGIRKHGFCSWHERLLFGSFAWLALVLLCGVAALGALEVLIGASRWSHGAASAVVILASGAVGIVALQRFASGLLQAQVAASQAICGQCQVFGRLAIVAEERDGAWLRVRCRGCGHEWVMEFPPAGAQ